MTTAANTASKAHFERQYQTHLKHVKRKGVQSKTIDAYFRAIRRIGVRFDREIDSLTEAQLTDCFSELIAMDAVAAAGLGASTGDLRPAAALRLGNPSHIQPQRPTTAGHPRRHRGIAYQYAPVGLSPACPSRRGDGGARRRAQAMAHQTAQEEVGKRGWQGR